MFYNSKRKMAVVVSEGPMIIKKCSNHEKKEEIIEQFEYHQNQNWRTFSTNIFAQYPGAV